MKIADTILGAVLLVISGFSAAQSVESGTMQVEVHGHSSSQGFSGADTAEVPDEHIRYSEENSGHTLNYMR